MIVQEQETKVQLVGFRLFLRLVKDKRCRSLSESLFSQTTVNVGSFIGVRNCHNITKQHAPSANNSMPVLI